MALKREGIEYAQADNAFLRFAEIERAQALADAFSPDVLHRRLDRYAQWLCPVLDVFGQAYHWSIRHAEYATDLMFGSEHILMPLVSTDRAVFVGRETAGSNGNITGVMLPGAMAFSRMP